VYHRVIKHLQKLEREGLLKSDSYGVKIEGKEKFWRILPSKTDLSSLKNQVKILDELGVSPTLWKVHSSLYEHEKACGELFVSLAVTNQLWLWEGEGDQKQGFRHDRVFQLFSSDDPVWYLEEETGSQSEGKWRGKVENYLRLFRETRQPFNVLFDMPDADYVSRILAVFGEYQLRVQYAAAVHGELVNDPLGASLFTNKGPKTFSNYSSKHIPSG
jgi:hypothetical protein